MVPIAILAGGTATRLRPASAALPKSLMPVAGEPFVAHQLRLLRREGIARVVLCIGHLGNMIRTVVGDGSDFGIEVSYSPDGDQPLGTGGALRQALPLLGDAFFVLYGDSYLDISLTPVLAAFRRCGAPALMSVFRNEGRLDTSNVDFDGVRIVRHDKRAPTADMRYIDYGLGIFSREALASRAALAGLSPTVPLDLADIYAALAADGNLAGYEVTQRFYEIGTPEGLAATDAHLRQIRGQR